jgi:hypothetical protein
VLKVEGQHIVGKSSAGIYKCSSGLHLKAGEKMICFEIRMGEARIG